MRRVWNPYLAVAIIGLVASATMAIIAFTGFRPECQNWAFSIAVEQRAPTDRWHICAADELRRAEAQHDRSGASNVELRENPDRFLVSLERLALGMCATALLLGLVALGRRAATRTPK